MDHAERMLFERSLRRAVETHSGAALDSALVELGWHDALTADMPEAVSVLFELQGLEHRSSSALDQVLASSLALDVPPRAGFVLPPLGRWCPPGEIDGGSLRICGLSGASLQGRETAVVVAGEVDCEVAFEVPVPDLTLQPVRGVDPDLGLVEVTGTLARGDLHAAVVSPTWSSSVALAQLALGHELVGVARKMLELARHHALERIQFGRPISSFQAVRHRLADTLVGIESADAVLQAAWEDASPTTASVAKALAGRGARMAARHCQQVLAGIGFTTEHQFHRYLRRSLVLNELFGASRSLTRNLGLELLATGRLPDFAPL